MRRLMDKYVGSGHALPKPTAELHADLREAQRLIAAGAGQASVIGVIEGWIGQQLRMRTPGLNGPLRA